MRHVGVDGCKAGWVAVFRKDGDLDYRLFVSVEDLVAGFPDGERILIDIPIGLPWKDVPVRPCDSMARSLLGTPRRSSVFAVPCRAVLEALTLDAVRTANVAELGRSLAAQSWGIVPKIAEVDRYLSTRRQQSLLREVHPEVCFWALAGRKPMAHGKHTGAGIAERLEVLGRTEPQIRGMLQRALTRTLRKHVGADDLLDACVAFVTAEARLGTLTSLSGRPSHDPSGLPMEMLYLKTCADLPRNG